MEWFYTQDAPDEVEKIEAKFDPTNGFAQDGEATIDVSQLTF